MFSAALEEEQEKLCGSVSSDVSEALKHADEEIAKIQRLCSRM